MARSCKRYIGMMFQQSEFFITLDIAKGKIGVLIYNIGLA